MLPKLITRIVYLSSRHAGAVVALFAVLVLASGIYVVRNFAINTEVSQMIGSDTPWARRDAAIAAEFPERGDSPLVGVRAPAPELTAKPARKLAARLRGHPQLFHAVSLGAGNDFFRRHGLLYLSTQQVGHRQHGPAAGAVAGLHQDRRRVLPARPARQPARARSAQVRARTAAREPVRAVVRVRAAPSMKREPP